MLLVYGLKCKILFLIKYFIKIICSYYTVSCVYSCTDAKYAVIRGLEL